MAYDPILVGRDGVPASLKLEYKTLSRTILCVPTHPIGLDSQPGSILAIDMIHHLPHTLLQLLRYILTPSRLSGSFGRNRNDLARCFVELLVREA
jgi:hypothetical protein